MVKENYGDPHFQVKNYLFKEEIKILTDQDIFENLVKEVQREITSVRLHFISESNPLIPASGSKQKEEVVSTEEFLLPKNIIREANLYSQTNLAMNSPNLCLMNL